MCPPGHVEISAMRHKLIRYVSMLAPRPGSCDRICVEANNMQREGAVVQGKEPGAFGSIVSLPQQYIYPSAPYTCLSTALMG